MTVARIPHIVQYQGSKRKLASEILRHMPSSFCSLTEPFAGVASVSIAAACEHRTDKFFLNDINMPLIDMLREAVEAPGRLLDEYSRLWSEQFSYEDRHTEHFYFVRDKFNRGEKSPANMLYLLARCVKGAVRYSADGKFNQSPDKRRHGTSPAKLKANIYILSELMKNKAVFSSCDYNEIEIQTLRTDLVKVFQILLDGNCDTLNINSRVKLIRLKQIPMEKSVSH